MKNIRFPWWASPSTLLVISLLVVFYAIVFVAVQHLENAALCHPR